MKILLPPSEKKNEPEKLKALKLNALSFQVDLTATRNAVLKKHKEINSNTTEAEIRSKSKC